MWFWTVFAVMVVWAAFTQPKMSETQFQNARGQGFFCEGTCPIIRQFPESETPKEQLVKEREQNQAETER